MIKIMQEKKRKSLQDYRILFGQYRPIFNWCVVHTDQVLIQISTQNPLCFPFAENPCFFCSSRSSS